MRAKRQLAAVSLASCAVLLLLGCGVDRRPIVLGTGEITAGSGPSDHSTPNDSAAEPTPEDSAPNDNAAGRRPRTQHPTTTPPGRCPRIPLNPLQLVGPARVPNSPQVARVPSRPRSPMTRRSLMPTVKLAMAAP